MAITYRRDEWLQDAMGNAVSGVYVYVCSQPANSNLIPPSPLAQIYSDSEGLEPISQPVCTDGNGHASYYALPGVYTVVYFSTQIATPTQSMVLTDQIINAPVAPGFANERTGQQTISGVPDGTNVYFKLTAVPNPTSSLVLSVNGVIQVGWSIAGATVTLSYPPQPGDTVEARYAFTNQE